MAAPPGDPVLPASLPADTPASPAAAPLKLDLYLPYLINRAGVSLATRFSGALRQAGVTLQDWRVLAALREHDGQRLTELAVRTSIEVSTLSRLVGGLETAGLVSRTRDSGDARAITIRLTPGGETVTATLTQPAEQLERTALTGLSETEIAKLKDLLNRVYGNLVATPAPETDETLR